MPSRPCSPRASDLRSTQRCLVDSAAARGSNCPEIELDFNRRFRRLYADQRYIAAAPGVLTVMNAALALSRPSARRERALLARRREAEGRASRERSRNASIALGCFVALVAAVTFGIHASWAPPALKLTMSVPTDAASLRFAENHLGRLFFDSLDGAICREMWFSNDDGRFSDAKTRRCDDPLVRQEDIAAAPQTDARARAFSIRSGFTSR